MLEYIKIFIMSLFSGALLPLPTSAAAHFSFLNVATKFSEEEKLLGFYYSLMTLVFSLVIFVLFRRIYISSFKSVFSKDGKKKKLQYRNLVIGTGVSLALSLVLCIPVSEGRLLMDYFDLFLKSNGVLLVAVSSVICGLILLISSWYMSSSAGKYVAAPSVGSTIRFSVYQLFSYVIPGLSHVSCASTNMLTSDIKPEYLMVNVYTYIAPQAFLISLIKIIRAVAADNVVINPMAVVIAVIVSGVACGFVVNFCVRANMRKLMLFFSIYSIFLGLLITVGSFII